MYLDKNNVKGIAARISEAGPWHCTSALSGIVYVVSISTLEHSIRHSYITIGQSYLC